MWDSLIERNKLQMYCGVDAIQKSEVLHLAGSRRQNCASGHICMCIIYPKSPTTTRYGMKGGHFDVTQSSFIHGGGEASPTIHPPHHNQGLAPSKVGYFQVQTALGEEMRYCCDRTTHSAPLSWGCNCD